MEEGLAKKWRAKEEEMDKIGKLNWVLEERVKSLCVENQIWRELAQTNEATANTLRSNLEQVLAHVKPRGGSAFDNPAALADDAQSCCGSNYNEEWRTIAACGGEEIESVKEDQRGGAVTSDTPRCCRECGKEE